VLDNHITIPLAGGAGAPCRVFPRCPRIPEGACASSSLSRTLRSVLSIQEWFSFPRLRLSETAVFLRARGSHAPVSCGDHRLAFGASTENDL